MVSRHRIIVALFALVVAGTAAGVWRSRQPRRPAEGSPRPPQGAVLAQALQAIAHGDSTVPRDRWDPAYVAERLGPDPLKQLRWVRERSLWVPYHGVLRGPAGVLMDGQGNSLDRALLLASLLTHTGHQVRLAHGEMSDEQTAELLPRLVADRHDAAGDTVPARQPAWRGEVQQLAAARGFNAARLLQTLDTRLDDVTGMFRTLDSRTEEQWQRLRRAVPKGPSNGADPAGVRRATAALRDHWWVQVQEQDRWIDLDILGDARGAARVAASQTVSPEALDSTAYHRVAIRLVAERSSSRGLVETVALRHTIRTADLTAGPVMLQIMPESWRPGFVETEADRAAAFRAAMLDEQKWRAAVTVGKTVVAQAIIERSGQASAPSGEGFGGLGGAIAGALGNDTQRSGELSAAWLEYEVAAPGQPTSVIRRQLFDLVGPAARSSRRPVALELDDDRQLDRSLALFRSTEILPLGSAVAPSYLLHLAAQAALANGKLLGMPGLAAGSTPAAILDRLNQLGAPLPSPLYALAMARMPLALEPEVFLDQPNVISRHDFLVRRGSHIERLTATDIVANEVGVTLDARDRTEARRRQGVRDTNAEALVHGGSGPRASVADLYAEGGQWVTVTSADDQFVATLPPDLRARIVDDLHSGHVLVVPAGAAAAADGAATGWWRVDPLTGGTLGVSGIGWGQSMVEKAAIIMGAVAVAWTWEYLICSGSLSVPGSNKTVASAASPLDRLTPPLYASSAADDECIFDAWVAGITAGILQGMTVVWPFLVGRFPGLKFFERPAFATGGVAPGEAPPIFGAGSGNNPAAPPKPCPPAGGMPAASGNGAGAPPPEPGPAPEDAINPLAQTGPGVNPGETPPAPPDLAPEDAINPLAKTQPGVQPAGAEPGVYEPPPPDIPYYPHEGGGIEAVPPERVDQRIAATSAHKDAMDRELDEALINYRQASDEYQEAARVADQAKVRDEALRNSSPGSDEANQAYEEYLAAQRAALDKYNNGLLPAQRSLKRAQYAADGASSSLSWLYRLAAANQKMYEAGLARDEALAAFERTGMNDFHSPEWERYAKASERWRDARRDVVDAFYDKPSPPRGTDNTQPALAEPSIPPTERAPEPSIPPTEPGTAPKSPGAPAAPSSPTGCGGSPGSAAAQSAGGAASPGAEALVGAGALSGAQ